MSRAILVLAILIGAFIAVVYSMGSGAAGDFWGEGEPTSTPRAALTVASRDATQSGAAEERE